MVIAPDHMLIPGVDCAARRKINLANAKKFIVICPKNFKPMATAHGETIAERVKAAVALRDMGYRYIALGGLAAQAARKQMAVQIVRDIRKAVPKVHLHVLGLSSPEYARQWNRIGVQSFDGSSHFKQAFTGGAFYTCEGAKLVKHQAARPGNAEDLGIVAPKCHCLACVKLRKEGVDTRSFGSNEHNMGRAAHNMNMLMLAQQKAMSQGGSEEFSLNSE
jgi:tRNA-guanine family transglycosylase